MNKYRVGFWYTQYGVMEMEANSPEEAEEKVKETLATNGLEDIDFQGTDLDIGAQDAELVEKTSYEKFTDK